MYERLIEQLLQFIGNHRPTIHTRLEHLFQHTYTSGQISALLILLNEKLMKYTIAIPLRTSRVQRTGALDPTTFDLITIYHLPPSTIYHHLILTNYARFTENSFLKSVMVMELGDKQINHEPVYHFFLLSIFFSLFLLLFSFFSPFFSFFIENWLSLTP